MNVDAALVALICGFLIPPVNALVMKSTASPGFKSVMAIVLAGLTAVGAKVFDVSGAVSVKQLAIVAALALISAGGSRLTAFSQVEEKVAQVTGKAGLG